MGLENRCQNMQQYYVGNEEPSRFTQSLPFSNTHQRNQTVLNQYVGGSSKFVILFILLVTRGGLIIIHLFGPNQGGGGGGAEDEKSYTRFSYSRIRGRAIASKDQSSLVDD